MIVVYGQFSTLAFAVNGYLALRVCYPQAVLTELLRVKGFFSYAVCCAGNWGIHLAWMVWLVASGHITPADPWSFAPCVYVAMLASVVNDDIVLLRWLWNRSGNVGDEAAQAKSGSNKKKN